MKRKVIPTAAALIGEAIRLWWQDFANNVLVSLAMVIACLTLVLSGPALLAAAQVAADFFDGMRTGIAGWWAAFRKYFWKGLLLSLTNIAVVALVGLNVWFYSQTEAVWAPLLVVVFLIALALWLMTQFYALGYFVAQSDKSLWLSWKNGFLTILASPVFSLVLGLFAALLLALSVALLLPFLLGSLVLMALLSVLAVRNRLLVYGVCEGEEAASDAS
jgi:uncharacterized membrane protein YesL